jgi:hypothetical protein
MAAQSGASSNDSCDSLRTCFEIEELLLWCDLAETDVVLVAGCVVGRDGSGSGCLVAVLIVVVDDEEADITGAELDETPWLVDTSGSS